MSITHKLEELLVGKGNRYRLVVVASKRARELNAGASPLLESEAQKTPTLALEELLQGKIKYERRAKPPTKLEKKVLSKKKEDKDEKKTEK